MDVSPRPDRDRDDGPAGKLILLVATTAALLAAVSVFLDAVFAARRALATPSIAAAQFLPVQSKRLEKLAKGRFLIAGRGLRDPNFHETVVLLINYGREGAMGLVVNRNTGVGLSTLIPEAEGLADRQLTLFIGGPVSRTQMFMLFRSQDEAEGAEHVFDDVYVSSSEDLLDHILDAGEEESLRVYAGYAGWSPRQLDAEVKSGAWHIVSAEGDKVFDPDPSQVWRKLIEATETRWVDADTPYPHLAWMTRPGPTLH